MSLDDIIHQFELILDQLRLLWGQARQYYQDLPYEELGMRIIVIAILIIFVISVLLSVAVLLLRLKNSLKAHRLRRLESLWEKTLISMIMSEEEISIPELKIKRRNQIFFVRYLYRFAERLQGRELERVKELAQPYLSRIAKGLKGSYPELRARNVHILGTFGFPEYIDIIKTALNDKSPMVTMTAARTLARKEYPEHCKVILPVLSMFDQWSMSFLASMLAEMGIEAAPELRKTLSDDKQSIRVRIACAEALRTVGDLTSGDLVSELLGAETDSELLAALLRLIGQVGTSRHRPVVIELFNAHDFIVRVHALSAIGQIGKREDGELVQHALNDDSNWVVLRAVKTLHQLGRTDILEAAEHTDDPRRAQIIRQVLAEEVGA